MFFLCLNLIMLVVYEFFVLRGKYKNFLDVNSFIRIKIWILKGNCRKNNKD